MWKRLLLGAAAVVVAVLVVMLVKTMLFTGDEVVAEPVEDMPAIDVEAAAQRLSEAVTYRTISHEDRHNTDMEAFRGLHAFLARSYPRAHQVMSREVIAEHSLVYVWQGSEPTLDPLFLVAHLDVVPVEPGTEKDWVQPPFSGAIDQGYIWGRGTLDDKVSALGILEAIEALVAQGFKPRRTVILGFGGDEEIDGDGAQAIAKLLKQRKIKPLMAIDEGHFVIDGIVPGVSEPVAMIGISEKGFASIELSCETAGGHSSMPPKQTSVGILAQAVVALERQPLPSRVDGPTRQMFEAVGPYMAFGLKLVFANLWLLEPVVLGILEGKPTTNATVRTTTAATMFEGSVKANVLPQRARAVVNFRIAPGHSIEELVKDVRARIDDERVKVAPLANQIMSDPSPVAPTDTPVWQALRTSIKQTFPEAIVAPGLTIGATDSRFYVDVAQAVYRFLPLTLTAEDTPRIHGTNERIKVEDYGKAITFYVQLIRNIDALAE